jgi:hypothetical protein
MTNTNFTTNSTFLTDETLHEAYELNILNKNGDPVRFGELVAGKGDSVTTLVIFGEFISYARAISRTPKQANYNQFATSSAFTTRNTFTHYPDKSRGLSSTQFPSKPNQPKSL